MSTEVRAQQPTVAISQTFFTAFSDLPAPIRKKVQAFLTKYQQAPLAQGLNLEKLGTNDYWSARVDDNYRAIIFRVEKDNVCVLMWVDAHDVAYDWAKKHVCKLNSLIGGLQVYETVEMGPAPVTTPAAAVAPEKKPSLFESLTDDDLLSIGVPQDRVAFVRRATTPEELTTLQSKLPADAYESLSWYVDGETIESIRETYKARPTESVRDALQTERSQRSFRVVEDDADMARIVNASLQEWRVFLHPLQKKLVTHEALTPMLVRGAAGTGKTVVAMHRAVYLVRRPDWKPEKKLLFTTFTTNLAVDLRQHLQLLCSPDELERIEVTNLHAWVGKFLQQRRVDRTIVFPGQPEYEGCWQKAVGLKDDNLRFTDAFVHDEWLRVILPNNVTTEAEYLRVARRGRGVSVTRSERKALWPVFEAMRGELTRRKLLTSEDACFLAAALMSKEVTSNPYGAVVVDETQDLGSEALKLLACIADQDADSEPVIFMVGDGQQRIYGRTASMTACGINVRGRRSMRLRLTYRTTEEIRKATEAVLKNEPFDDMDEGTESLAGNRSVRHGKGPQTFVADSFDAEVDWIAQQIDDLVKDDQKIRTEDICVVARTKKLVGQYKQALEAKGYTIEMVARNKADSTAPGIRLATMHRIKGLEFKSVFIVGANAGTLPLVEKDASDDPAEIRQRDLQERALFYVAASRARDALFVSGWGRPGVFLTSLAGAE